MVKVINNVKTSVIDNNHIFRKEIIKKRFLVPFFKLHIYTYYIIRGGLK